MKQSVKVLWVDDDSPEKTVPVDGFVVQTAKSCKAAVELINSKHPKPDWIVVDLVLPQGTWGNSYVLYPGLELLRHLKPSYKLLAFSMVVTDALISMAKEAGALQVFAKNDRSWHEVLQAINGFEARDSKGGLEQHAWQPTPDEESDR